MFLLGSALNASGRAAGLRFRSKRAKIPSPPASFLFARLLAGFARFFGGWGTNQKGWRVGLEKFSFYNCILSFILIFVKTLRTI